MSLSPLVFALFGYDELAKKICSKHNYEIGKLTNHQFPDEETLLKIHSDVSNREVIIVASLEKPNLKILPLLFFAETARDLGATRITFIAPYLAYMRQDKQFHPNEGFTAKYFAKLISRYFDKLITVEPHLHRIHSLNEIYTIPTKVLYANKDIAQWISKNVTNPILIGPDEESKEWVYEISQIINAPFVILEKTRKGDRSVEIEMPDLKAFTHHTPILIDDIISTGISMLETIFHLKKYDMLPPICIGVHGVFVDNSYEDILSAGAKQIVTCNTVLHASNGIEISGYLQI